MISETIYSQYPSLNKFLEYSQLREHYCQWNPYRHNAEVELSNPKVFLGPTGWKDSNE